MLHSGLMSILKSQIIFWKRNEKWGIFSFKKPSISTLEENSVYCNYVCTCTHTLFIAIISIFCPMSSMCTMQSVTTEKLLSIAFWIIKKTLLVVLCYNSIAQNYYRIWQGRRLIKRCRYTFSHQISMLPLPKNMKNDFSAALPPMQYNA